MRRGGALLVASVRAPSALCRQLHGPPLFALVVDDVVRPRAHSARQLRGGGAGPSLEQAPLTRRIEPCNRRTEIPH
eukprot:506432-Prymnesium_polylepis.1